MANSWSDYQEEAATFFRALGLDAKVDANVQGVRTKHAVDVLVESHHAGFNVTWIVECKHWRSRVSKLHVLALREIVADVGADRGILLTEAGFQSGALEAATLTNVHLTSLADVEKSASREILSMRFRELYDRVESCRDRYWDISKDERIEHGLRHDVGSFGYSGAWIIDLTVSFLTKAFRGAYPIDVDPMLTIWAPGTPTVVNSAKELICIVEPLVVELEGKLDAYRAAIARR